QAMRSRTVQLATKALVSTQGRRHDQYPPRVPPEDFRANLTGMVRLAKAAGITPILITAPTSQQQGKEPVYLKERWFKNLAELVPTHRRYAQIVREVAAREGAPLCDMAAEFDKLSRKDLDACFIHDGIHLTPKGDEVAARALYECFERNGLPGRLSGGGHKPPVSGAAARVVPPAAPAVADRPSTPPVRCD
ncbi:MAG: GDSL-type esterase/lipase family protein, partial [bacterium]|nr:GDSL-type esterase/lipase family protein [bacterium]